MNIQLNTATKTITVIDCPKLIDLVNELEKLLPKNSPLGHWKEYSLVHKEESPTYVPYYPYQQSFPITVYNDGVIWDERNQSPFITYTNSNT